MKKILIIRFSSFGDIVQCAGILPSLKHNYPEAEISWLTRSEFTDLLEINPLVDRVISFNRKDGLKGLFHLAQQLASQNFELIYDAHNNLRSLFLRLIFHFYALPIIVRSKFRWKRLFLFRFKKNLFQEPFMGISSYLYPLTKVGLLENTMPIIQQWNFSDELKQKINEVLKFQKFIALAPSAAWEMKRWPLEKWKNFIEQYVGVNFVILGGPQDQFCQQLEDLDPKRVQNLAGKTSLIESCYVVSQALSLVSGDTGLLHVGDVLNIHGVALIGPTACYPTNSKMSSAKVDLACRPCSKDGRGGCTNSTYKKCMMDISVSSVLSTVRDQVELQEG